MPKIYGDFNNADKLGRIRLLESSKDDIRKAGLTFVGGMEIEVSDGDISSKGIVRFSKDEKIWVAEVDWNKIKNKYGKK